MTNPSARPKNFSFSHHVPHYSRVLFNAVKSPLLIYFAAAGNFVLLLASSCFYWFERGPNPNVGNYFDAVWWAFSTVSTVGFGDIVPVTVAGRLVAILLMIFGVVLFVGFTAILVSVTFSLTAQEIADSEALTKREYEMVMDEIKKLARKVDHALAQGRAADDKVE